MHTKLKWKFTLVCTGLTGLVLLAACLAAYGYSSAQVGKRYEEAFEQQSQTLSIFLAGTRQIRHSQLYRMEQDGRLLLFFYDNGTPLYLAETRPEQRQDIHDAFVRALRQRQPDLQLTAWNGADPLHHSLEFESGGQPYLGKYVFAPAAGRQWYSFFLIRPMEARGQEIRRLAGGYALLFVLGLGLLFGVAWLLARGAVRPVEQAHRRQNEFIAAASHELKSPLAVVVASADYARHRPEAAPASLDAILAESRRMSALVDDLLLLSGGQSGRWRLKKEPLNPENILLTVYENYLPVAKGRGQALRLVLPDAETPPVPADGYRLVQLVSVLVSNALAYSPPGEAVELALCPGRKSVEIRVVDHGPGIPDEEKERVFEKFYRSDQSRSDKNHFGLGLSVAQELARLHGGALRVHDTPGGGCTFAVTLST